MKLPDAAVAIAGTVLQVEATRSFETKQPDGGYKVLIATAGDGLANVKLRPEEASLLTPSAGEQVAWMIRYGAYSAGANAETYVGFVRRVSPGDLAAFESASGVRVSK